eukprot:gene1101-803_t
MAFFLTLEGLSCFFFQIFDPAFDTSFHPSVYQKHTSCASNIEKTFLSKAFPGTAQDDNALLKYPWYAMSESLKTRQMLADAFRQRIVVDTGNAYFHAMLSDPPYHVYLSNSNRFVEFGNCRYDQPAPLEKVMSVGAGV